MSWAMVMIGAGAASAGASGIFLPVGQRLSVVLALVLGAGVGVMSLFLLMLGGAFDDPERSAQAFLVASILGLVSVIGGLGLLFRRARRAVT